MELRSFDPASFETNRRNLKKVNDSPRRPFRPAFILFIFYIRFFPLLENDSTLQIRRIDLEENRQSGSHRNFFPNLDLLHHFFRIREVKNLCHRICIIIKHSVIYSNTKIKLVLFFWYSLCNFSYTHIRICCSSCTKQKRLI